MEFIIKIIKGFILGIAGMTAGGATFAILFGIYDRCMEIIANPFKNFKENIKYVFPIVLGIVVSVSLFGNAVIYLFNNYEAYVKCAFLGIIVGGIPMLIKTANKNGYNKKYLISLLISFLITIGITYISNIFEKSTSIQAKMEPLLLIIYGMIFAFGAVMPSMSTIPILMFLGVFNPVMEGFFTANFSIIIPFGIGYILLVILTAKIITYLLKKAYGYTYYAIIGFSVTSLGMLVPTIYSLQQALICLLIIILTSVLVYKITKLENILLKNK